MKYYPIEGVFKRSFNGSVTIKVIKSSGVYDYEGIVLDGSIDWYRKQIGQVVLKFNKIGENKYQGMYNAYHMMHSHDMGDWFEIEEARTLDSLYDGDIYMLKKGKDGGTSSATYNRVT